MWDAAISKEFNHKTEYLLCEEGKKEPLIELLFCTHPIDLNTCFSVHAHSLLLVILMQDIL